MLPRSMRPLSTDLDDPNAQPYFIWDEEITVAELQRKVQSSDPHERALWMGRIMREARYQDVWRFLRLTCSRCCRAWSATSGARSSSGRG